jgi:hypothetical protein
MNNDLVDTYWKEKVYPQEKRFVDFTENLTKWYFSELLAAYGSPCIEWINVEKLAKSCYKNLTMKIMEFEEILKDENYSEWIGKSLSPDYETRLDKAQENILNLCLKWWRIISKTDILMGIVIVVQMLCLLMLEPILNCFYSSMITFYKHLIIILSLKGY